jgi:hypothetical protein
MEQTINSQFVINNRIVFSRIEDEITHFLRNNLTDRKNRANNQTESFSANGLLREFELTQDLDSKGRHKVMNIRSVTINNEIKKYLFDYDIGFRKDSDILGKLYFWNRPEAGALIINYDSHYSFIYPEAPRVDLTSNSYPRVSVQIFNVIPKDVAVGGQVTKFDITIMITVVDLKRGYVENLTQEIVNLFVQKSIKHGFKTFDYIREPKLTPLIPNGEDPNDLVYMQQVELNIPAQYVISK